MQIVRKVLHDEDGNLEVVECTTCGTTMLTTEGATHRCIPARPNQRPAISLTIDSWLSEKFDAGQCGG